MQTVVILICTFNRPRYLDELLTALAREVSSAPCKTLSVIIVDNGTQDVSGLVATFQAKLPFEYVYAPGSGIVGARNCSLRHGLRHQPDYLVFIDDDEVPEVGWLGGLLSTMSSTGADFAVGPVKPKFSTTPPSWAPEFFTKTGEAFCTSNLIIRAAIVPREEGQWFQARFNSTGGEDGEFLSRLASCGASFAVAHSATVLENIPEERVTARYLWRRGFRDGIVAAKAHSGPGSGGVLGNWLRGIGKICYGFNHLFWSVAKPQRFYRAIDDISMGSGLILGSGGASIKFYGT